MELTLHLGAHRTGSTAISDAFWFSAEAVKDMGTGFRRPNRLRKIPNFEHVERLTDAARQGDDDAAEALNILSAILRKDMRQAQKVGRRRMIYSEENILGFMEENLDKATLYPALTKRLDAYCRVLPDRPARIGMGVRSYDSLWVSTYNYTILRRTMAPFAQIADRLAANVRGWADVVGEVRAYFPEAELFLWKQEDLPRVFRDIVVRLGRIDDPARLTFRGEIVNPSLSAADVSLVHLLRQTAPDLRGDALIDRLAAHQGDRPPPSPGFSPDKEAAMRARYDSDLATLERNGIEIMRPPTPIAGAGS